MDPIALRWQGGLADVRALARLREQGRAVALALAPDAVVPDFLLEEQAAAMGAATAPLDSSNLPGTSPESSQGPESWRAVVCWSLDKDLVRRFAEEVEAPALAECRTFVVDGPGFARRIEAMAGEVVPHQGGWRLELGLRGC